MIAEDQNVFIKTRKLTTNASNLLNIRSLQNVIMTQSGEKTTEVIVSLDSEKAFHRVELCYLMEATDMRCLNVEGVHVLGEFKPLALAAGLLSAVDCGIFLGCGNAVSGSGDSQFGAGQWSMLNVEVHCNGTEDDPWKCELKQLAHNNCSLKEEAAGVICAGRKVGSALINKKIESDIKLPLDSLTPLTPDRGSEHFPQLHRKIYGEFENNSTNRKSTIDLFFMLLPTAKFGTSLQPSVQHTTVKAVNEKELRYARLVGPEAPCVGELKVYYRGQWNSVCSSLWDSAASEIVCKQIGCVSYHTTLKKSISEETRSVMLDKVQCYGTESSLSECQIKPSGQENCETGTIVTIFCTAEQNAMLEGGRSPCAGRVKAGNFDSWRTICGRMWDMNEARVVCKYLGCGEAVSASGNSQFGAGQSIMLNVEVHCNGIEENPWKCELKQLAHNNCSLEEETAGVICAGHKEPRLVGGADACSGRLEIQYGDTWGTVCDFNWDSQDARVVCTSLKCGDVIAVQGGAHFGEGTGPIWQDFYGCQGNETILWDCPITPRNQQHCTHRNDVSVICSGQKGPRLVGGNDTCSGRVEILLGDTWGTVCNTSWDLQDAAVVCNQLGCGAAISTPGGEIFGEGNGSIWNDINECIGNELRLSDCPITSWGHHRCTHRNDAGIICSVEDWQMRLVNGESVCDGRVEVYYGGVWGRVIDTQWNFKDADVVCRQLNCGYAIRTYNHLKFGKGTGPVWMSNVRCNGSELSLWNCTFTQATKLSVADDVGVVCSDHVQVRLVDGESRCAGRVELYYNGDWGSVCDDSWDLADAHVVCNQLKCGEALNATVSGWFGPGEGPIWLDNINCTANESALWECPAGSLGESDCNHKEDAGVICSEHRAVRLQNGPNPCQGRVEVFYNATWGTVCADSFGIQDAEVVCKQLSCGSARSVDREVTFGRGTGPIWLDDVDCRLHESLLWQCPSSPWGQHNCKHKEDIGVICSEMNPIKIRYGGSAKKSNMAAVSEDFDIRLAAGFNNCSGRVEIFFSGAWGTVCDDSWDRNDAAVVCRQLNCGQPVWTPGEMLFDKGNGEIWMHEVKCKGSELFLWDCQFSSMGDHDCTHKEDVNVICSGHVQYEVPFNKRRLFVFIIPCIFLALFIANSIALVIELQRSFQKDQTKRQHSATGFPEPVYEEIDIDEIGPAPADS
ncbi:scavenger receptor cysteine-rich domain-containing protein DMBT1-like [Scyliorhinus torazame]|uniref:scavenger receptor cysteine-rich domain-containing protein DMBT1-like n=1 Tax=Scyliorhinus torazame TaxID=75743 RepID=UPI003B5C3B94